MQLIGQISEQIPADLVGLAAVVAGLAAYALLWMKLDAPRVVLVVIEPSMPVAQFEPNAEFRKVMDVSLAELEAAPDLRSIQAQASTMVDAADHAINRLRAECARVTTLIDPPAFEPARQLEREPAAAPKPAAQQPLAA